MKQTIFLVFFHILLAFSLLLCDSGLLVRADGDSDDELRFNDCIGYSGGANILPVGFVAEPGEAVCDGDVQLGVFEYDMGLINNGQSYTKYQVELRKAGKLVPSFPVRGRGIPSDASQKPFLGLQWDANLQFYPESYSGCIVLPGRHTHHNRLELSAGDGSLDDITLTITDVEGDVVWKWPLEDGERYCYPELGEPICRSVLYKNERMSWDEYLCTFDSTGQIEYQL
jgi:hypothetical protein